MTASEAAAIKRPKPAAWVQFISTFSESFWTIGPCKDMFTRRQCINLHKLLVMPIYLFFICTIGIQGDRPFAERSYATASMLVFVCHGVYGILWVLKDIFYTDPSFQAPASPLGFVSVFLVWPLSMYYFPMYCLVTDGVCPSEFGKNNILLLGGGLVCYIFGVFYHFGADIQKSTQLKNQRCLITSGFFQHCRNPNYFGEILIYTANGIFSGHAPFVLACFSTVWLLIFVPNMLNKEASMSRYPEWKDYVSQSGFIIPWMPGLLVDVSKEALSRHASFYLEEKKA